MEQRHVLLALRKMSLIADSRPWIKLIDPLLIALIANGHMLVERAQELA
ncbi:hypothetical protein [Pseudomonas glycinae]